MVEEERQYWFYQWLDERHLESLDEILPLLDDKDTIAELQKRASDSLGNTIVDPPGISILAGSGLDLSGDYPCAHVKCRILQANDLFKKAWLYFDKIIVADPLTAVLTKTHFSRRDPWKQQISDGIQVAVFLRQLGAEPLIDFQRKTISLCEGHIREALEQVGAERMMDDFDALLENLARGTKLAHQWRISKREVDIGLEIPGGDGIFTTRLPSGLGRLLKREGVRRFLRNETLDLAIDTVLAEKLKVPFGSANPFHQEFLTRGAGVLHPSSVAFEIEMPFLNDVPMDVLLRLREEEADTFERFRSSLRKAIRERLANPEQPTTIAKEIREDIIEPELLAIKTRLSSAQTALEGQTGIALGVGGAVTTFGLLTGLVPLAAGGLLAMAGGVVLPRQQHIDKQADIELSDMFFLWQARQRIDDRKHKRSPR